MFRNINFRRLFINVANFLFDTGTFTEIEFEGRGEGGGYAMQLDK